MKYNMWTIEDAIKRNIILFNSDENFTNDHNIEMFEEGINNAIAVIMKGEGPAE